MRKRNPWYSFRLIVPALIVLPPLGLILLWKSPRTPRTKLAATLCFLVFVTGAFVGAIKSGAYARYLESRHPSEGVYNVRMDSRQNYVSREVLPFERKIFAAIVSQMRMERGQQAPIEMNRDISDYSELQPGLRAYEAVGDAYGLDYEDVEKIYHKVSVILGRKLKK